METNSSFARVVYVLATIATIIGFTAFSQKPAETNPFKKPEQDSSKAGHQDRINGERFDHLELELKHLDMKLNHLDEEIRQLDFSKMQHQIDKAMKEIDFKKISQEMERSLKKVDWNRINREIENSIAGVDKEKRGLLKKKMENAKKHMAEQKLDLRFAVPEIDTKKIKLQTERAMNNARKAMENAKAALLNRREFTEALQRDGLIEKAKPYTIEVKSGELYLNGIKQSKEISDKYKRFYRRENFIISSNEPDDGWI